MLDPQAVTSMPPGPALGAVLASADLGELDADQTLAYLVASDRQVAWQEARRVEALGHFADLHATVREVTVPGMARLVSTGGEGTPDVDEFAVDEYAAAVGVTRGSAHGHLGVALDLRHRLPSTFAALRRGEIAMWRARMVAEQTRRLDRDAAAKVDAELADKLPGLGWRRLRDAVEAAAIDADPAGAEKAAEQVKPDRGVDVQPDNDHGLKRMSVTGDAADVIRFDAAVDYVADLLATLATVIRRPSGGRRRSGCWPTRITRWPSSRPCETVPPRCRRGPTRSFTCTSPATSGRRPAMVPPRWRAPGRSRPGRPVSCWVMPT